MRHLAILLLGLFLVSPAFGDLRTAGPAHDDPLSVHAEWDFSKTVGDPGVIQPTRFLVGPAKKDYKYLSTFDTRVEGVGQYSSEHSGFAFESFEIHMANWIDREPWKDAYVFLSGYVDPSVTNGWSSHDKWNIVADPIEKVDKLESTFDAEDGMFESGAKFRIWPNPDWEIFSLANIPDGVVIQYIGVRTISIPEPSSLVLAGLGAVLAGGFVLVRRRRQ